MNLRLRALTRVFLAAVFVSSGNGLPAAEVARTGLLALEAVHRIPGTNGTPRFLAASHLEFETAKPEGIAFLAVVTNGWPAGLVPVFALEKSGRIELRRRPVAGMESSTEPIFFGLPPRDEAEAARINGRWECRAVRNNGNTDHLAWELALDGDRLAGRFDPTQEYRVATIAGGTFRSNRVELHVEYFMDRYVLTGAWRDGKLRGDWRHVEETERGTWEATQVPVRVVSEPGVELVALYEWRRISDDVRRYATDRETVQPGWRRADRALCRVWTRIDRKAE